MPELPTLGTVTMLFTDIEGSTVLLQTLGDDYAATLDLHRMTIRQAIHDHGGHEMGTEGDSFFVVFARARDGLLAAVAAQQALRSADWPLGQPVRVRMGVHTGEPLPHDGGYVGLDVHLAARIAGTAHGGQVVVSSSTQRLVEGALPPEVVLRSLGSHRLKDLQHPEPLFQAQAPGLPSEFPPLRSLGAGTSLPTFPTPLLGRGAEFRSLVEMAAEPAALVTLVGPGGVGKTRLAVAVAVHIADSDDRAVYFVDLHTADSVDAALSLVADAVGGSETVLSDPRATVRAGLAARGLVVLDNIEQIADAPQMLTDLRELCPHTAFLVTSRRPLHLRSERLLDVPPLAPQDAEALFLAAARLVRRDVDVDAADAQIVQRICERLDRLPLGIELAAARFRLLSPAALLARLDLSLGSSKSSGVDRPDRQRTLRTAIEWSVDILSPATRAALEAGAAFDGGADVDAFARVLAVGESEALELAEELADCSLLSFTDGWGGEPRLSMLSTVREFASERLRESPLHDEVRRRHALYFADLAESNGPLLHGPSQTVATARLRREHANMSAALSWCLREDQLPGDQGTSGAARDEDRLLLGLRISNALVWYWYRTGQAREGRQLLDRLSDLVHEDAPDELVRAVQGLAVLHLQVGEVDRGMDMLRWTLARWRQRRDQTQTARALNSLGVALRDLGDTTEARLCLNESLSIAEALDDDSRRSTAMSNLAQVAVDEGLPAEAVDLLERSLSLDHAAGDTWGVVIGEANLSAALTEMGRLDEAWVLLDHAASVVQTTDDLESTADVLERGAALRCRQGRWDDAGRLVGAASHIRAQAHLPLGAVDRRRLDEIMQPAVSALGREAWEAAAFEGRSVSTGQSLATLSNP